MNAIDPGLAAREAAAAAAPRGGAPTVEQELDFWDLLDIVNPLQHLPIVSTLYRAATGDTIKPAMRIMGGALFGGPIGAVAALVGGIVEQATGQDPGDRLLALVTGAGDKAPPTVAPLTVARAKPAPEPEPEPASGPPLALLASRRRPPATLAAAAPPPWIAAALAEAEAGPATRRQTPEWIATAMAQALDKYGAMVKTRRAAEQP